MVGEAQHSRVVLYFHKVQGGGFGGVGVLAPQSPCVPRISPRGYMGGAKGTTQSYSPTQEDLGGGTRLTTALHATIV
jgi:hypothetical protein